MVVVNEEYSRVRHNCSIRPFQPIVITDTCEHILLLKIFLSDFATDKLHYWPMLISVIAKPIPKSRKNDSTTRFSIIIDLFEVLNFTKIGLMGE